MNFQKLLLFTLLFILQFNVTGQITLTLDNVPMNVQCDEVWTEENLNISFTQTTDLDCSTGSCFFGVESNFVWLFPSRMVIDLSTLQNITKIEVDVIDFCGVDCTKAFLADSTGMVISNAGNTIISSLETFVLTNTDEAPLTELAISSCEGQVQEIRIFQSIVSSVPTTYSDLPFVSYPNPGSITDDLHFRFQNDREWATLERIDIFTLDGKQVFTKEIKTLETLNGLIVPAADLPKGIFIIRFKLNSLFFKQKAIRL